MFLMSDEGKIDYTCESTVANIVTVIDNHNLKDVGKSYSQ